MKVLVTGGAGYIGSTVCSALEEAGHRPVVLDSLVTGQPAFTRGRTFYHGDVADQALVQRVFEEHPDIAATLHFAARIVVTESVAQPALYYRENVVSSLALFETLLALGQERVIFSSSASIYASPPNFEVTEESPLAPLSPYARTKWMTEQMLADLCAASAGSPHPLRAIALRYFNPIGADPAGRSGPYLPDPSHVLGRLMHAASQAPHVFTLTGTDYPTRDGSGLRDYIHVWDLAQAHVAALERFDDAFGAWAEENPSDPSPGFLAVNVGTGRGVTVRELVDAFQAVSPRLVEVTEAPRRPGDSAGAAANTARAARLLGWTPRLSTHDALTSAFAWEARRAAVLPAPAPSV